MPIAQSSQDPAAAAPRLPPKTAVVVIHGMGEQKPMQTLWGLVRALWSDDPALPARERAEVYSKPDFITGSFELRRITTRNAPLEGGRDKRVDFFELYWAHLMTGNTTRSVTSWVWALLVRPPSTVPARLRGPWLAGLAVLVLVGAVLGLAAAEAWLPGVLERLGLATVPLLFVAAAILAGLINAVASKWVTPVAGDAARYLSAKPDNVEARQKIREAGLDLLRELHACGYYDRIVLVGHSLGAVVGYDILNYAWGAISHTELLRRHPNGSDAMKALAKLEAAAGALLHAADADAGSRRVEYRAAQRTYFSALAATDPGRKRLWVVSDFVTVGCPLSKADVLLARDEPAFRELKERREAPTCPPWLESDQPKRKKFRFSYPDRAVRAPHHAAVFGPVVWTNIYFDNRLLFLGDIISGPVAPQLGRGILDVHLRIGGFAFRHLDYWKDPASKPPHPWLKALRRAVNLKWRDDAALWGAQATLREVEAKDLPDT